MATKWSVKGEYMEACSCDFVCPCILKNMTTPATNDFCKVALAFDIQSGQFGDTPMDGVRFVMFVESKSIMGTGDWIGGVVIDSSATDEQTTAVGAIAGGSGGGPLAMLDSLLGDFRGVERHPIEFHKNGNNVSVKIEGLLDQAVVGIESMSAEGECVVIDNTLHPANKRLNLASVTRNLINAFGIEWLDNTERTNGHFASFEWQGEAS